MPPTGTTTDAMTPAPTPSVTARRAFLADLTRAMRTAAEEQRAEVLGRFRSDAEACVADMQHQTDAAGIAARDHCETDVAGLEEWCAEELRRIRTETDERIAARRRQLDAEVTMQSERLTSGVASVEATVAAFEGRMTTFFERLLGEEDPTAFAGLAERMPEPPAFGTWSAAGPVETMVPETADLPVMAGTTPTTDPDLEAPMDLAALEADALAAAEAEAAVDMSTERGFTMADPMSGTIGDSRNATGDPTRAQVCALGLVSVASVSGFKRALARSEGVHTVHVTSGPQGEFVFSLTCDPEIDLAATLQALPGFDVEVRGVGEGRVDVVARERE